MKASAGLMPYRRARGGVEVFLVHPGGPFWGRKDAGSWTIAKGEPQPGEDDLAAAIREFSEETGFEVNGPFLDLGVVKQAGGKTVHGYACAFDCDPDRLVSNMFQLEWPPGTGKLNAFPEVDRAAWFDPAEARRKINPAQAGFLDMLEAALG
ncbi:MAG TPA: NUDIX domain-containing protein [Hyphomonadaceae bacterium]|nr:NUDIX domain-containing protein [Hyphomonadaceae bacterium]